MLNKICIYNNKIFLVLDFYLAAYCYQKSPKSEDEKFSECLKIKLPVNPITVVDSKLYVIDNYFTGLKSLLIFLYDTNDHCNIFIYSDAFRNKLQQITLPTFGINDAVFVSDGPTFLLQSRNEFHIYPLTYYKNKRTDFTFPFSDVHEFKVLQFKCMDQLQSACQPYLYLIVISSNVLGAQSLRILVFLSDMKNQITNFQQLTVNKFFPEYYESLLKAVEITKAIPHLNIDILNIKNMDWKETESVICTENECFIFSNADLKYYFKLTLPLTVVMCIKTDFINTFSGNINLVLALENKSAYFVEIKQDISSEVVKEFTEVAEIFIGDFLMKGSKQGLLLKETDLNSWQNNIILYDLSSFMLIDSLNPSSVPDNCLKATITGLERKVQTGKSTVQEVEYDVSQKSAATADALIKLNEYKVPTESLKTSNTFQQSLVDLILSKDENKVEAVPTKSEPSLKLIEEKCRFVNNQLIISLCFLNEKERCICYPSIKVLKRNRQLVCIQKLFLCDLSDSPFPSEYGRQIDAKMKFYIVLTLENIAFQTEEDLFMILNWYNGSTDEFINEVFTKEDKKLLTQDQVCIQTRIKLSDIFQQSTPTGNSIPDLLFTRALQQRTNFCITSLYSDISRLEEILMKSDFPLNCLNLLENSSTKCVVFNNPNFPLFGIHFIITKSTHREVDIAAYSRSGNEICFLVHYLYQHLPKDVMISPQFKCKEEQVEDKKKLALCMKDEVDMLISSFNTHNISEEMRKSFPKLMSSQTVGTLTIPKTDYHRIRSVLVKKECVTDTLLKSISQDAKLI